MMSSQPSGPSNNLLWIAATLILLLTARRFFEASRNQNPQLAHSAVARPGTFAREPSQPRPGRVSRNPFHIPWAGWKEILWRAYVRLGEDRLLATAAGVVFFGLLAVFPAITALVSFYGLFADPSTIAANLQTLALLLPEGTFQIVQDQVARVLAKGNTELGATFLFGLALAIWSANAGVKAVIDALNVAYEEREKRSFVRLNLLSLAFTLGGMAAAFPRIVGGARHALPIWAWPAAAAGGVAERRYAGRRVAVDRRVIAAVLVPVEFCKLQRNLWLAGRGHRPDDVDVDVGHHRAVGRRAELGNRTSDRAGFGDRPSAAA
jgi:membrane protein